MHGSAKK